ncbi:MAG: cupin domain-containing protein [Anaerolineae bacterium]
MGIVHRYKGQFDWEGVSLARYPPDKEMQGVSVRWLIGPAEMAPNFALRYFEIEPGGWSSLDRHTHDHGVVILRGRGQVLLGEETFEISFGDVVYIPPHEAHQFKNIGDEALGFLCVIPAKEKIE